MTLSAMNLNKVKVPPKERAAILDLISNHGKLYKQKKAFSADTLLKMLKVEVTTKKRPFVAERLRMLFTTRRSADEKKEIAKWLAR